MADCPGRLGSEAPLVRHTGRTCASIIAWLDHAQVETLHGLVDRGATGSARWLLLAAGVDLPDEFDLAVKAWRKPFHHELRVRLEVEDTSDEPTANVPDYAEFATDLRELGRMQELVDSLTRDADLDLGAEFGWDD